MKPSTVVKVRVILYTLWALTNSWGTAMAGVKWSTMGWEEQSCLIGGMLMSWSAVMMAFFDKAVAHADEERKANGNGTKVDIKTAETDNVKP